MTRSKQLQKRRGKKVNWEISMSRVLVYVENNTGIHGIS